MYHTWKPAIKTIIITSSSLSLFYKSTENNASFDADICRLKLGSTSNLILLKRNVGRTFKWV